MLTFPPLLPGAARARMELALTQADEAFQAVKNRSVLPDGDGGYVYRDGDAPLWDAAAGAGLARVVDVTLLQRQARKG